MRSSLGRTRLGAEHVLGVQKIATARFPMAVVLAVQDLCLQRAQEAILQQTTSFSGCTLRFTWWLTPWLSFDRRSYRSVPCTAFGPTATPAGGLVVSTSPDNTSESLSARW
jgi:hypothetical protein